MARGTEYSVRKHEEFPTNPGWLTRAQTYCTLCARYIVGPDTASLLLLSGVLRVLKWLQTSSYSFFCATWTIVAGTCLGAEKTRRGCYANLDSHIPNPVFIVSARSRQALQNGSSFDLTRHCLGRVVQRRRARTYQ